MQIGGSASCFKVHEAMKRAFSSAQDYGAGNVRSCAEGYSWWRHNAQAPQQARVCVERLLALTPRWSCIGKGCEECHSGPCLLAKRWETHGNLGEPKAPSTDEAVYAAACDASSTLDDVSATAHDPPRLVEDATAEGPRGQEEPNRPKSAHLLGFEV